MAKFAVKDENGNIVGYVDNVDTPEEAKAVHEGAISDTGDFPEAPFPEMNQPGQPVGGIGPTEAGQARLKGKSPLEALDIWASSVIPQGINAMGFGLPASLDARFGKGNYDKTLEQAREITGPTGELMVDTAAGMASPAGKFLPSSWRIPGLRSPYQAFEPGIKEGVKRVAGTVADVAAINAGNAALRDENPGAQAAEGLLPSLGWSAALESLFGLGRMGGKKIRQGGMSPADIGKEDALAIVGKMLDKAPKTGRPDDPIMHQLPGGADYARSRSGQDPVGFQKLREDAQLRAAESPGRFRQTAADVAERPIQGPGAQKRQIKEEIATTRPQYLPEFEKTRTMPGVRAQLDLGQVNKAGKPIKTGVTIPRGYEDILGEPTRFKLWNKAQKGGQELASTYSTGRNQPAGQLEKFWYTIRTLRNGSDAEKNLAESLADRMRERHQGLDKLISAEAVGQEKMRGVEVGKKSVQNPDVLPLYRGGEKVPEAASATAEGFLGGLQAKVNKGTIPVVTPELRATAERLLGPQRADVIMRDLTERKRIQELDKPLVKGGKAPDDMEAQVSRSAIGKALSRIGSSLAAFGPHGGVAAMGPAVGYLMRNAPRKMTDEQVAGLMEYFRGTSLPKAPTKNPLETIGTHGNQAAAVRAGVSSDIESERRDTRSRSRRLREKSKEFLEQ